MKSRDASWNDFFQEKVYEAQFEWARLTGFAGRGRVRFYNKLARATERQQNIKQVLERMRARNEKNGDAKRLILRRWIGELNNGRPFSAASEGYLPSAERMMIAAGETNGNVSKGFRTAEYIATAAARIRGAVFGALAYPTMLLVLLSVLLYVASFKLLPIMEGLLPVDQWPPMARGFHGLTSFIRHYGILTLILAGCGVFVVVRTMPTWKGELRAILDRTIPPWTIYREIQASSVLISLAAILESGQSMDQAIDMQRRMATPWLQRHLAEWLKNLRSGKSPGPAADTGLFSKPVQADLEDYTDSGTVEEAMKDLGRYAIEDAIERISVQAKIMNGVILVMVTGVLLWMYSSMTTVGMAIQAAARQGTL
jgi:type II secretory pathway component PulF